MLHTLRHIALVGPDKTVSSLFGGALGDELQTLIPELCSTKLASAPFGSGLAVGVPIGDERWCIWVFGAVPPIKELSATFEILKRVSASFASRPKAPADDEELPHLKSVLSSLAEEPMPRRHWTRACFVAGKLASALVEDGAAAGLALARVRNGKIGKLWLSDTRFEKARDEVRALLTAAQTADGKVEALDRALVAERLGVDDVSFNLPKEADGYALVVVGPKQSDTLIASLSCELIALVAPIHKRRHMRLARYLALAAVVAGAVWLSLPARVTMTVPGVLLPDDVYGVPLSSDATLQEIRVIVGDKVQQGDVIAKLRSVSLEEQKTQGELEVTMEALNGETALAESNYGGFQIAEKRLQIAKTRLAQINTQIADLTVRAPYDGRVVSALSKSDNGRLLPLGTELARVQRGDGFLVRFTPTRLDANQIKVGTKGVMYVRGVQGAAPGVTLISPPYIPVGAEEESTDLIALGELGQEPGLPLISGMSGYARLEGEETRRILALTRNLREFIKVKVWYYLGLHW